jgi:hypothetical protein
MDYRLTWGPSRILAAIGIHLAAACTGGPADKNDSGPVPRDGPALLDAKCAWQHLDVVVCDASADCPGSSCVVDTCVPDGYVGHHCQ